VFQSGLRTFRRHLLSFLRLSQRQGLFPLRLPSVDEPRCRPFVPMREDQVQTSLFIGLLSFLNARLFYCKEPYLCEEQASAIWVIPPLYHQRKFAVPHHKFPPLRHSDLPPPFFLLEIALSLIVWCSLEWLRSRGLTKP